MYDVPHLRFPEFSGEWEKCKFGDIATGFDYGMNAAAKSFDGENKYIRITDIDEASSTYGEKDMVSPDGILSDNYLVKDRDILLARTGASTGKSYLYKKSDGKLYYAGFLIRANVTKHNPYFVFSQLHTHRYWRWVSIMSARSGNQESTLWSILPFLYLQPLCMKKIKYLHCYIFLMSALPPKTKSLRNYNP